MLFLLGYVVFCLQWWAVGGGALTLAPAMLRFPYFDGVCIFALAWDGVWQLPSVRWPAWARQRLYIVKGCSVALRITVCAFCIAGGDAHVAASYPVDSACEETGDWAHSADF